MNAVEIADAVAELAAQPFDAGEFPYAFLRAFGNKETTLQRLRAGSSNASDIPGAILQRNHIHMAVCEAGKVSETFAALKASPRNAKGKVRYVLATDGVDLEAEELATGDPLACRLDELGERFGFFLPLAGISTVAEIKNNPIDIKATNILNKLYVELLKENEDWGRAERRQDLNQLMARLIFCFFAEDTGIFVSTGMFTACVQQMTDAQSATTHEVLAELFRAMDTPKEKRAAKGIKPWADIFPYVNGGLFSRQVDCPRFSKIARSYLLRAGQLSWKDINPDIFGSMIQAVAEDDESGERAELGMHYTSVPNIRKVLDPLFLDHLNRQLEEAGDNPRKLLNLRKRIANIRVFDPACGSGNFLVIAYREMRAIEAKIIERRKDPDKRSWIKLTNFYGIEIKSFAAEIARLSLLVAEFQCNVRHIGQREACLDVLPLHDTGHIVTGNALRLNWLDVCPPAGGRPSGSETMGTTVSLVEEDLGGPTGRLALEPPAVEVETYICGNPPYFGSKWQSAQHKADLASVFAHRTNSWKYLDYVCGWFMKAADYGMDVRAETAFVSTNSVCQGQQVPILWPLLYGTGHLISFAHSSFKWANLAAKNAGVTVVVIGLSRQPQFPRRLYETENGQTIMREVANINAYLVPARDIIIEARNSRSDSLAAMLFGNMPRDGGHLCLSEFDRGGAICKDPEVARYIRRYLGSEELIQGKVRFCLWIEDREIDEAKKHSFIKERLERVATNRLTSKAASTRAFAAKAHRFVQIQGVAKWSTIAISKVSSERREYLPVDLLPASAIISDLLFGIYDAPLWNMAVIASRLHLVWIATVCGKLETRYRYSNTLGWNTFPVPPLTEGQKRDLTRCAEDILLAREAHFPATIADLYDPEAMPANLRAAHDANDETLERIYIGRRFRNDTERLEKLFEMYTRMTKKT